jgi:hypothetical protein
MATIEERVKAVTARILKLDPDQIKPEHSFTGRGDRRQMTEDRRQRTEDR